MKKIILATLLSLALLVAFGLDSKAEMAKEGTYSATQYGSGTAFRAVPMGEEHFYMSYEIMSVVISDTGKGFLHNVSVHVIGSFYAVKGVKVQESGVCVYTDLDGDKVFLTWKTTSGKLGGVGKGTGTFVGGTGKYTGITGDQEWTWSDLPPPAEGTFAGICKIKGNWKLP